MSLFKLGIGLIALGVLLVMIGVIMRTDDDEWEFGSSKSMPLIADIWPATSSPGMVVGRFMAGTTTTTFGGRASPQVSCLETGECINWPSGGKKGVNSVYDEAYKIYK